MNESFQPTEDNPNTDRLFGLESSETLPSQYTIYSDVGSASGQAVELGEATNLAQVLRMVAEAGRGYDSEVTAWTVETCPDGNEIEISGRALSSGITRVDVRLGDSTDNPPQQMTFSLEVNPDAYVDESTNYADWVKDLS